MKYIVSVLLLIPCAAYAMEKNGMQKHASPLPCIKIIARVITENADQTYTQLYHTQVLCKQEENDSLSLIEEKKQHDVELDRRAFFYGIYTSYLELDKSKKNISIDLGCRGYIGHGPDPLEIIIDADETVLCPIGWTSSKQIRKKTLKEHAEFIRYKQIENLYLRIDTSYYSLTKINNS